MELLQEWTDWKRKIIKFGGMDSRVAVKALTNEASKSDIEEGIIITYFAFYLSHTFSST